MEATGPDRGGAAQVTAGPSRGQGIAEVGKKGQGLVLVPFEAVPEEEAQARRKQAANAKRTEARTAAQDVLCAAPRRLGQVELTRGETNRVGAGHSEEEASDRSQPYVPEWPHVTKGSNLASAEASSEWLQNCLPPNVLEVYKEMGANSVIGLGVQSALLGAISTIQAERVIAKQARHLKDWRRVCKRLEETTESGKTRRQELAEEVAALTVDLTQAP